MRTITIPYAPRPLQRELHKRMGAFRFGVVVAHRRFGKSVCFWNELQKRALSTEKERYRGAFIGPQYSQVKQIVWDYAKHYSACVPGAVVNESELRIDYPNGARVRLYGADNPDSLRGLYFDDVVLDEFDLMRPSVWGEVLRPALSDRGGNAYFIGTFKQVNGPLGEMYDMAQQSEDWFTQIYRASETDVLPVEELRAAGREMGETEYAREYECVRSASVVGAIYGALIDAADADGRITSVPHDPGFPVVTGWDLGIGDQMSIWFAQPVGREVRMIDYYEASGEPLSHYTQVLSERDYQYSEHIAPHDIGVREMTTGKSRLEVAHQLGVTFTVLPRISQKIRPEVEERIEAGRRLIPLCVFDAEKCKVGLDALRSYKRNYNEVTKSLSPNPAHDWASHGADAFGYLAVGIKPRRKVNRPKPNYAWVT